MGPSGHASSLSGRAAGKVGEGAERPGPARCLDCFTVSTKQTTPRSRFPRAGRLAAVLGPCRRPGPPLREDRTAERADPVSSGSIPRHAASRGMPSIDIPRDPRTLLRPGFIARPQPAAIGALDPTPSPPTGWGDYGAVSCCGGEMTLRVGGSDADSEGWARKLVWPAADCSHRHGGGGSGVSPPAARHPGRSHPLPPPPGLSRPGGPPPHSRRSRGGDGKSCPSMPSPSVVGLRGCEETSLQGIWKLGAVRPAPPLRPPPRRRRCTGWPCPWCRRGPEAPPAGWSGCARPRLRWGGQGPSRRR